MTNGKPVEHLRAVTRSLGCAQLHAAGVQPLANDQAPPATGQALTTEPAVWTAGRARMQALLDVLDDDARQTVRRLGLDHAGLLAALAAPTELLLLLGGDDRQIPHQGCNSYRLPVYDMAPVASLSSCTVTPADAQAVAAAADWQGRALALTEREGTETAPGRTISTLRSEAVRDVLTGLGLPEEFGDRTVLVPSGTDAEALVSAIALGATRRRVRNILVGAAESGSGSYRAASGRRFHESSSFAHGQRVDAGIEGFEHDRLEVVDVSLRDATGRARRTFDVEAEIDAHLEDALEQDMLVIVHVMAISKTGLVQPTLHWVRDWSARERLRLRVVVDAAQGRTSPDALCGYLAAGASLIVTGSKALSAPPFCGALVLGLDLTADAARLDSLPAGLAATFAAVDLPPVLRRTIPDLEPVNAGLLARWHVAGVEARVRDRAGPDATEAAAALLFACRQELARHPRLLPLPAEREDGSILSFAVRHGEGVLGKPALCDVYGEVVSGGGVHIGQPVELVGGGAAVLRLAIGAAAVNRLAGAADITRAAAGIAAATVDRLDSVLRSYRPERVAQVPVGAFWPTIALRDTDSGVSAENAKRG